MEKKKYSDFILHATVYKTHVPQRIREKKWEAVNEEELRAPMPGTILKVFVAEGDTVKKGTPLLILEAMKMRNRIIAPFNATVEKITVEIGGHMPKNALLIQLKKS